VLADPQLFRDVIAHFGQLYREQRIDVVVGIESRGFIFAAPLALELGAGFVPVRKPGKLPFKRARVDYDLEYGTDALEAHEDAFGAGGRTLLVDDVLATGGDVIAACFLVELSFLHGRSRLPDLEIQPLVRY
jgi:adenine phosphoribosyltransferase